MLDDRPAAWSRGDYHVTTDRAALPLDDVLALLHTTYWAAGRPREVLERAVRGSVCFVVRDGAGRLAGFARVVSDLATYGYLCDVVVVPEARGAGVGTWLVRCILDHPDLRALRRLALLTRDAAPFYEQLGFTRGPHPGIDYLERRRVDAEER